MQIEKTAPFVPRFPRSLGSVVLLAAALAVVPACSNNDQSKPALALGQVVQGSVTYNGKPVDYGFVLFYSHDKSFDQKRGTFVPTAFAPILGGKYEIGNAPLGHVMVVVATDPDLDLRAVVAPASPIPMPKGKKGGPGQPKGMPLGLPAGPFGGPEGGPPGGPPGGMPGGMPVGHPKPGAVQPLGGFPPGFRPPPASGLASKLTDEQKETLRTIHARYGVFGRSGLAYNVQEGQQTYNIELK